MAGSEACIPVRPGLGQGLEQLVAPVGDAVPGVGVEELGPAARRGGQIKSNGMRVEQRLQRSGSKEVRAAVMTSAASMTTRIRIRICPPPMVP